MVIFSCVSSLSDPTMFMVYIYGTMGVRSYGTLLLVDLLGTRGQQHAETQDSAAGAPRSDPSLAFRIISFCYRLRPPTPKHMAKPQKKNCHWTKSAHGEGFFYFWGGEKYEMNTKEKALIIDVLFGLYTVELGAMARCRKFRISGIGKIWINDIVEGLFGGHSAASYAID